MKSEEQRNFRKLKNIFSRIKNYIFFILIFNQTTFVIIPIIKIYGIFKLYNFKVFNIIF